ncbi:MAG: hypothetical protein POELPBGB_00290 [Bacteroidia bacterium]|nr:hypothetical protein [Bacteroidia bacterium]
MILHHLKNPFANPEISEANLDKIVDTHINRLINNNQGGTYTQMINDTPPLFQAWRTAISTEAIEKALREGRTISVNDAVKIIKAYISRKRGVIKDIFAEGTPGYELLYPNGAMEYSDATLGNLRTLTERWIASANASGSPVIAAMGPELQLFLDAFITARTNQLQSAGEVIEKDSDSDIARAALVKQVYKNLLGLLIIHIDDVNRVIDFFDLSITKKKKKTYTLKVNGNTVKNITEDFAPEQLFEIENKGTVNLLVYTADAKTTPHQGWGINIAPGTKQKYTVAELGGLRAFLNVHNQNPAQGTLSVKLVDA